MNTDTDAVTRMLKRAIDLLDTALGDSDPMIDDDMQADAPQAKTVPFVMCLDDVVEMWNSVIADSFEDELIEFAAKAINFYKDSLPGSAAPNAAEQADEAVTLPYVERFRESRGEGGGVYPDDEGDYMRYSDFVELFAARAKDSK